MRESGLEGVFSLAKGYSSGTGIFGLRSSVLYQFPSFLVNQISQEELSQFELHHGK